jgi:hypothetical protein
MMTFYDYGLMITQLIQWLFFFAGIYAMLIMVYLTWGKDRLLSDDPYFRRYQSLVQRGGDL